MVEACRAKLQVDFMGLNFRLSRLGEPLLSLFEGFEFLHGRTVWELEDYKPDIILVIPISPRSSFETLLGNLADIDIPTRTGLIIALDQKDTLDANWLNSLENGLKKYVDRFEYVKLVFTTLRPLERVVQPEVLELVDKKIKELHAIAASKGIRNPYRTILPFFVIREEIRLIVKYLNCKYVLWLDADTQVPKDVINRLLRHVEKDADLATGWYLDRHHPIDLTSCGTEKQLEPLTDEERQYYDKVNEYFSEVRALSNECLGIKQDTKNTLTFYFIYPERLKNEKEPIDIMDCGFGCVLVKKEVNDSCSFFSSDWQVTEDVGFCLNAKKKGYRLILDPTCYCVHKA